MILIDTSAWVEFFRGRGAIAQRVDNALEENTAALCGPVLTELHRGLQPRERRQVLELMTACHELEQPPELWQQAGELGYALRRSGLTTKTFDLLIATYAICHQIPLLTADKDFKRMQDAGAELYLVQP
ncbi:MAG TPA: PIN domain-containing protein [Polyangiaceae bacterium]|nr:PIN domain-containing protein [Polyangiaceae bacterium]